jgi:diguanylate cyclase (GGDEF)-like protein/PAS domain S-box-containing protein
VAVTSATPDRPADPNRSLAEVAARFLPDIALVLDADGTIRWASDAITGVLGYQPAAVVGTNAFDLVHPDDLDTALAGLRNVVEFPGRLSPSIYRVRHLDGHWHPLEVAGDVRLDEPGVEAIILAARSITHRTLLDAVLQSLAAGASLTATLELLAHAMSAQLSEIDVVIAFDGDDDVRQAVGASLAPELCGLVAETGPNRAPWHVAVHTGTPVIDPDLSSLDPRLRALVHEIGFTSCAVTPIHEFGGRQRACIIIWSRDARLLDVAAGWSQQVPGELADLAIERRHHLAALEYAARHDPLTGLPNRAVFFADLERESRRDPRVGRTLFYLDLDEFKVVNDSYGHTTGDLLLVTIADRIRQQLRPGDLVARLGGDELAVCCPGTVDDEAAETIADRLVEAICCPADLGVTTIVPGLSIGIAIDPSGELGADALLEAADRALYQVKRAGRGGWLVAG